MVVVRWGCLLEGTERSKIVILILDFDCDWGISRFVRLRSRKVVREIGDFSDGKSLGTFPLSFVF